MSPAGPITVVGGNRDLVHLVRLAAGGLIDPATVGGSRVLAHLGREFDLGKLGNPGDPTGASLSLLASLVFGKEGTSFL